jgi:hypothetical protein
MKVAMKTAMPTPIPIKIFCVPKPTAVPREIPSPSPTTNVSLRLVSCRFSEVITKSLLLNCRDLCLWQIQRLKAVHPNDYFTFFFTLL